MKSIWKAILIMLCMLTAVAEDIITLPGRLKIIESEAFLNAMGITNVVVPTGAQQYTLTTTLTDKYA